MIAPEIKTIAFDIRRLWSGWKKNIEQDSMAKPPSPSLISTETGASNVDEPEVIDDTKRYRISISVTDEQNRIIINSAKLMNMEKTPFIKKLALCAIAGERFMNPAHEQAVRQLTLRIRDIGVLFNQIAKYANTYHKLRHGDLSIVKREIKQMEQMIVNFIRYDNKKPITKE